MSDLSHEELERLPPAQRLAIKAARQEARQAKLREAIGEPPTKGELIVLDAKLGAADRSDMDHPIFTKDNFATKYNPETKQYTRGDRRSKPVAEASFSQIDGTSSRQDNANNRYLQGGGVQARSEANKYRFVVNTLAKDIDAALIKLGAFELRAFLQAPRPKDDRDEYKDKLNELLGRLPKDEIYGRIDEKTGKQMSLAKYIRMWQTCLGLLKAANDKLDTTVGPPIKAKER